MRMTAILFVLVVSMLLAAVAAAQTAGLKPDRLRCESAADPLGIGERVPRLSWIVLSSQRGQAQSAYRILAATKPALLAEGRADLWDSGKVASDRTAYVEYEGKPLAARHRVYWTVRTWDREGRASDFARPAAFELGLLSNSDWSARWISLPGGDSEELSLESAKWIWYPELDANRNTPQASRLFRMDFEVPTGKRAARASLAMLCDNAHTAYLNGTEAGKGSSWQSVTAVDVTKALKTGKNVLAAVGTNHGGPAALSAVLRIEWQDGTFTQFQTDRNWWTAKDAPENWKTSATPGGDWVPALEVAKMGDAPWGKPRYGLPSGPAPFLRREFRIAKRVTRARVYASAHGLYELWLDGARVGDAYFTPGWTDYAKRVQYQTYDVTDRLSPGPHAIGIVLGDGWYCGNVCWFGRCLYGPKPRGLVQLELEFADGSKQVVASDRAWKVATGPILMNDLLMGESHDARAEFAGWSKPGFDDSAWQSAESRQVGAVPLVPESVAVVKKVAELRPKEVWKDKNGAYVFDLGQNMVGWARLRVRGEAGTRLTLRFAEILNPDRTIYTANLRSAKQTDTYILRGGKEEVWEPKFTFHGFRYVEVSGYPGEPGKDAVTGIVASSAIEPSGTFECSSAMVNQLQHNIVWGMMGNYLEVPTDCPQRDERLGWMGDAQVFIRTACFNFDVLPFMRKWIQDVRDSQSEQGAYRDVAPGVLGANNSGAPAWGDAGVIVPWIVYRCYGDVRILERHFDSMKRWIAYVQEENPNLLWINRAGSNYGDWVAVGSDTPKDVLATAYFANSARLVGKAAAVLGKSAEAAEHERLFERIRDAFVGAYVDAQGRIKGDTQTCYLLALAFDLLPPVQRERAAGYLVKDIVEARGGHLSTGFVGTGHLAPVLSSLGRDDVAYRLLLNETFPSWGYSIKQGATTIWERWDGWTDTKGFQDAGMNSFNHYAFGCIGEWMYSGVAGIDLDSDIPGYKRFVVQPRVGHGITWAKASLESVYGRIAVHWKAENGRFTLDLTVPANAGAIVKLPNMSREAILEGGKPIEDGSGIWMVRSPDGPLLEIVVGGGDYRFECPLPEKRGPSSR